VQHHQNINQFKNLLPKQQVVGQMIILKMKMLIGKFDFLLNKFVYIPYVKKIKIIFRDIINEPPLIRRTTRRAAEEIVATGNLS
jgi:hypothetical protein